MLKDTYTGHQGQISTCKFISGTKLTTGSADRTIKIWDLQIRQCKIFIILYRKSYMNTFLKVHELYSLDQNVMI